MRAGCVRGANVHGRRGAAAKLETQWLWVQIPSTHGSPLTTRISSVLAANSERSTATRLPHLRSTTDGNCVGGSR